MTIAPQTAYDLLLSAPDEQVKRCQLAWRCVTEGEWVEAAHFLRNAANEEGDSEWARSAHAMLDAFEKQANHVRVAS